MPLDLYDLVCHYANFGDHRTGTAVDRHAIDWFADHLRALGADVSYQAFEFDRFEYSVTLMADEGTVQALPLFYSYLGKIETTRIMIAGLDTDHAENGMDQAISTLCLTAQSDGYDAVVLATGGNTGGLVAINRAPGPGGMFRSVWWPGNNSPGCNTPRCRFIMMPEQFRHLLPMSSPGLVIPHQVRASF